VSFSATIQRDFDVERRVALWMIALVVFVGIAKQKRKSFCLLARIAVHLDGFTF
jgi:hypothetical protein